METNDTVDTIRSECWEQALYNYGTAHIFEQRTQIYGRRLKALTFLGIIVPVIIGGVVLSFGIENEDFYSKLLFAAGVFSVIQLMGSVWSLSYGWQDKYSDAKESITANHKLSNEYQKLAKNPHIPNFELRFEVLQAQNQSRRDSDYKQEITEEEKRMGMRAGLRKLKRECSTCGKVPTSLEPSGCDTCGNFKRRTW
jgi:mobilome CxxCx(11)CxxC protein